jgi:hypothetical protein
MVAGFCNTNGFGTFLAVFILAITFRVLKLTPKTSRIWKLDCSGYLFECVDIAYSTRIDRIEGISVKFSKIQFSPI